MRIDNDGRTEETAIAARAGFLDRPVLVILVASTVIAVISLFATGLVNF